MKILLLGGSGMLGSDCKEALNHEHEILSPASDEVDIVSWDGVIENIHKLAPEFIINCAGFTDVDACETEEFVVRKVNVEGPRNLAQGSARFNCGIVHISSDYVFDGKKVIPQPYFEDDAPNPLSAYGVSKMESETAVRENSPRFIIIRTGWLYGIHGDNFITAILHKALHEKVKSLKVATDQVGSPTWTYRLAQQIDELLKADGRGTYHATAEGHCTRFEFARHVFAKLGIKTAIQPGRMRDFKGKAKRPANCILENRLLKKQGIDIMRDWKEDLDAFLDKFGETLLKESTRKN